MIRLHTTDVLDEPLSAVNVADGDYHQEGDEHNIRTTAIPSHCGVDVVSVGGGHGKGEEACAETDEDVAVLAPPRPLGRQGVSDTVRHRLHVNHDRAETDAQRK